MNNPEIIIRIPLSILNQIKNDLGRPHEFAFERVGFVASKHKVLKTGKIIVFIIEYFSIVDDQYMKDPKVGARINSDAIREAIQRIIDNKKGCFHIHSHPFSMNIPEFSDTDLKDNPEIIKSFGYAGRNQIHGMIVLGKNGLNALVKLPGKDPLIQATKIVVVGYPMIFSIPNKFDIKIGQKRYVRQTFLGKNAQFLFSNVKIGIVGLGGGGSHIVQQLAYLGIKNYVLFDYDNVDETNLNRMIGAGMIDAKSSIKKVNVAESTIKYILPDASVKKIEDNWMIVPEFLQECDIVFGCVDTFIGRRDLESECRRYLIPYIDIGMDIYRGIKKEPASMAGQIILSMPDSYCMNCLGFLTIQNLAKEAANYGEVGGHPQVVWSNGILASQAVGVLVDLITGWSGRKEITPYYSFDGNTGILTSHPRLKFLSGTCSHFCLNEIGTPDFKTL